MKIDLKNKVNFENAIRAMRMPYESFDKSDSTSEQIGKVDLALMCKLILAGQEHRKFLRFIQVDFETIAPLYWYTEMATYKYATRSSSSTMHLLMKQPICADDFNIPAEEELLSYIDYMNKYIDKYRENPDPKIKECVKSLLPEGYLLRSAFSTNYECLLSIYHQRANHELAVWRDFCGWILRLPYMTTFTAIKK